MNDYKRTGMLAYEAGRKVTECPFGTGRARMGWVAGWNEARANGLKLAVPVDLTAEVVMNAHRQLEAQIEVAVRAAFDDGTDFVREVAGTVDPSEEGFTTFRVNAGPWPIDQETPAGCVRYTRPANWPAIKDTVGVGSFRK